MKIKILWRQDIKATMDDKGFTLIELLVTILVLGIVITGLSGMYYVMQITQTKTQHYDLAVRDARTEIEELRNDGYDSLASGSTLTFTPPKGLPSNATGTVNVCIPNNSTICPPGLKRVDVTISYKEYGTTQTVTLSSDMGIIGITQ